MKLDHMAVNIPQLPYQGSQMPSKKSSRVPHHPSFSLKYSFSLEVWSILLNTLEEVTANSMLHLFLICQARHSSWRLLSHIPTQLQLHAQAQSP